MSINYEKKTKTGTTEYSQREPLPGIAGVEARVSSEGRLSVGGRGWGVSVPAFLAIAECLGCGDKARTAIKSAVPGYF